jgi:hypothetical protein
MIIVGVAMLFFLTILATTKSVLTPHPVAKAVTATLRTIALLENAVHLLPVEILRIAAIQTITTPLLLVWGQLHVAMMDFVAKNALTPAVIQLLSRVQYRHAQFSSVMKTTCLVLTTIVVAATCLPLTRPGTESALAQTTNAPAASIVP